MIIEIPDICLEPMRGMPVISNSGRYKTKNGDVLAWMGRTDELYMAVIMTRKAMTRQAEQLGLIKYNPTTGTWQGVDCDDD